MNEEDRKLLRETIGEMGGLKADLGEFRGEMREFKTTMVDRVKRIEERQDRQQSDPETCVTGRTLLDHIAEHGKTRKKTIGILSLLVSSLSLLAVILIAVLKS